MRRFVARGGREMWRLSFRRLLRRRRDQNHIREAEQVLRIASYNIHRSIGTDKKLDPERIRGVLTGLNADIIALQEVDSGIHSKGECQVEFIRRTFPEYHLVEGPTIVDERGKYGNVLLSKLPMTQTQTINLAVERREPRGAIAAQISWHGQSFWVVALHLGLRAFERKQQYQMLNQLLNRTAAPVIICGDFNEWKRYPRTFSHFDVNCRQLRPRKSFPSRFPVFPLDRVFCQPEQALIGFQVIRTPLTRVASDHLPVVARVDIEALLAPQASESSHSREMKETRRGVG